VSIEGGIDRAIERGEPRDDRRNLAVLRGLARGRQ